MFHGVQGGQFFQKAPPLAAGGKVAMGLKYSPISVKI
jgi:hypothetical protein